MGSALGVFDDDEIAALSDVDKEALRKQIIEQLRDSGILQQLLAANPEVRKALREKLRAGQSSKIKTKS